MTIIDYKDDLHRDTNVFRNNVYAGNGQGCNTVWYSSVPYARQLIKHLGFTPDGRQAKLCSLCKCHHSHGNKEWTDAPYEYACKEWKEIISGCSQS